MALGHDFEEQAQLVEAYTDWPRAMFAEVVQEWHDIADNLGLEDLGRLGPADNANVVRLARPRFGDSTLSGMGVLKVCITTGSREPELLTAYNTTHPDCAVWLRAHGTTASGRLWQLTDYAAGVEPGSPLTTEMVAVAAMRARELRGAFDQVGHPEGLVAADAELLSRLLKDQGALEMLAKRVGSRAGVVAELASRIGTGDSVLHGDYWSRNTLMQECGNLLVLDPCGRVGPAEADIALWIAIASAQEHTVPGAAVESALAADPDLSSSVLFSWIALNHMVLAARQERGSPFLRASADDVMRLAIATFRLA